MNESPDDDADERLESDIFTTFSADLFVNDEPQYSSLLDIAFKIIKILKKKKNYNNNFLL